MKVLIDNYPEYVIERLKYRIRGLVIVHESEYNIGFKYEKIIIYDGTNIDEAKMALIAAKEN